MKILVTATFGSISPDLANKFGREVRNFTTRNIGNTNVIRVVSGHILHVDFIYAILVLGVCQAVRRYLHSKYPYS